MEDWKYRLITDTCDIKSSTLSFNKINEVHDDNAAQKVLAVKVSDMNLEGNEYCISRSLIDFKLNLNDTIIRKLVPPGAIVFPKRGAAIATNKKRLLAEYAILDPNLISVISKGDITPEFLNLFFQSFDLKDITDNNTIPQLNKKDIEPISIPCPSLPEQRKIAHVLNTVQKAIEQQNKLISTTTELKKSLMQKLFTEGARGESQKETEIGLVPESWDVVELGKHSQIRTSFSTFKKLIAKYKSVKQGTEFFFLKVSDMNIEGNEMFIYESNNKFLNDKPTDFTNGFIKPNSLIFPKRGGAISTNKKRITTKYSVLDPNLIGVEPNLNIDDKFLYNYFEMFDLTSLQDNNVIPQLNKHNVAGVKIPLPSIEEQKTIAKDIEIIEGKINLIAKKKQTLTDLFKTLLHELMTGQRRVHDLDFDEININVNLNKSF